MDDVHDKFQSPKSEKKKEPGARLSALKRNQRSSTIIEDNSDAELESTRKPVKPVEKPTVSADDEKKPVRKQMRESVMNMKLQKNMLAQNALSGARVSRLDQGAIKGLSGIKAPAATGAEEVLPSPDRKMIKRASVKFENGGMGTGGANSDEVQIENDRLKTTIMIMSQKLKLKQEDREEDD